MNYYPSASPPRVQVPPLSEETVLAALDYKRSVAAAAAYNRGLIAYGLSDNNIGYALCLYHAATSSDTNPPSVELHDHGGITLRLHSGTCPPRFLGFFRRWADLVQNIKDLNQYQQNQLEVTICNLVQGDYHSTFLPASFIRQIAQSLITLARNIQTCRTSNIGQDDVPMHPQRPPWPMPANISQDTTYLAPSGIPSSPMYQSQHVMFSEHQSASPIDMGSNDSFIGGFRHPTSIGGFISPTLRNTVVGMPTAYPYANPVPPQGNYLFVAPLNPKRRSSPSPGRISPVQVQRASAGPDFSTWQLDNTIDDMTRSHRATLSDETNASIETASSGRTSGSCDTRVSASSAGTSISTQPARPTELPKIDTSFEAPTLSENEVFTQGDINSTDLTPGPTPTQANPLDKVVARIEAVRRPSQTEQAPALVGATTPTEVTISSGTTITALGRTQTTPIGVHTPASEIITQLCTSGCRNLTNEINPSSISVRPVGNGGFGQVYRARLNDGTDIALKIIGIHGKNQDKHLKHAAHELYTWSKCSHPNVAPLLGLAEFDGRIGMVSPWMESGDLSHYLTENKTVDKLDMCSQIASALAYLHSINIVHGDLKGPNVLVSNDGIPVLIDFGNAILSEYTLQFTQTTTKHDLSLRWTAPELMNDEKPSYKSDIYALGMTILEIFTGKTPYHGMRDPAVVFNVGTWKAVPERPTTCIPLNESWANILWDLLMSCWDHVPDYRPTAREVCGHLQKISDTLGGAK